MANDASTTYVTGSGITDQALQYLDLVTQARLRAIELANTRDYQTASVGAQNAATAAQLQAQLAGIAQAARAADQQHEVDLKQYGLAVADLNFRQRASVLQGQLQTISTGIDVVTSRVNTGMANYQQRLGKVGANLQIAGMLSDRKGPQDLYRYNNLLSQLSPDAPGGGSVTVDPYQWTKDLVQPISDALPSWAASVNPNPSAINQPYTADMSSSVGSGGGGAPGAGVSFTPPAYPNTAGAALDPFLQPGAGVAPPSTTNAPAEIGYGGELSPGKNLITTGAGGDTVREDWDRVKSLYDPETGQEYGKGATIPKGKVVWAYAARGGKFSRRPMMAKGGSTKSPVPGGGRAMEMGPAEMKPAGEGDIGPVVVGDDPSGMPTGQEELASVSNPGPDTQLNVQPANGDGLEAQAGGDPAQKATAALSAVQQAMQALTAAVQEITGGGAPAQPGDLLGAGLGQPGAGAEAMAMGGMPPPEMGGGDTMPPEMMGAMGGLPHAAGGGGFDTSNTSGMHDEMFRVNDPTDPNAEPGSLASMTPDERRAALGRFGGGLQPHEDPGLQAVTRRPQIPQREHPNAGIAWNDLNARRQQQPAAAAPAPQSRYPQQRRWQGPDVPGWEGKQHTIGDLPGGYTPGPDGTLQPNDPTIVSRRNTRARGRWRPGAGSEAFQQMFAAFLPQLMHFAAGGTVGTPTQPAQNYYGADTTTPTFTYNKYTPEQLGQMPFIKKLFGGMDNPAFQGFGQPISNPAIGVSNVPSLLNLQRYMGLAPTEQDMTQSLYEQGLGLDMRDVLTRSQRGAPQQFSFSGATAYG